jgi:hypothetical protein
MRSHALLGDVERGSLVAAGALLLLAAGCAAVRAHADPGSRIDRERELKARFSAQYRCPEEGVTVSGNATTFELSGCGKNRRYNCPATQRDAKEASRGCTEAATGRPLVPGAPEESPPVNPGRAYLPPPGPPGATH